MVKKSVAVIFAAVMAVSSISAIPVNISAESSTAAASSSSGNGKDMQAALSIVKSRISIPDEYSEFTFSAGEFRGMKKYYFTWSNGSDSYTAVFCGGMITSYSAPHSYDNTPCMTSLSDDDFVKMATEFFYDLNPSVRDKTSAEYSTLELNRDMSVKLTSNTVSVSMKRMCNGIEVNSNTVNFVLDKLTGEIVQMNASWWQNAEFTDSKKAAAAERIIGAYSDEAELKPWYRIYKDDVSGETVVNIVYEPLNSFIYDAVSTAHSTMADDYSKLMNTSNSESTEAGVIEEDVCDDEMADEVDEAADLTPAELEAIARLKTLITAEDFKKQLIKDKYLNITDKYIINSFDISKDDTAPSGYAINCIMLLNNDSFYRRVYITADAENGKLISFTKSGSDAEKIIDVKSAGTLAKEAAKYYFGDVFDEYVENPDNSKEAVKTKYYTESSRQMVYHRYVNNIQVDGDNIRISVNSDGEVISVSCTYTDADFGDGRIISSKTALKHLFNQITPDLYYDGFTDLNSGVHTYLSYRITDWKLNAQTGKLCDYYGRNLTDNTAVSAYTDISSSPYRDEINALLRHGVCITSDRKLNPTAKITAAELDKLLDSLSRMEPVPLTDSLYYSMDGDSVKSGYVTRAALAAEFTNRAGIYDCALFSDIFKSPFKDVKEDDPNLGFICLAYGLGAIEADSSGNFHPDSFVTREYALHCLYSYIING